jgi:hypothetical protein
MKVSSFMPVRIYARINFYFIELEAHPNGLEMPVVQLGHNLMDHFRCGASGSAEVLKINTYGRRRTEFMFQDIKMSETIKRLEDLVIKEVPVEVLGMK